MLVHVVPLEVAEVLDHFPAEQTLVAIRDFPHRHSTSSKEKFSKDAHRKYVTDDFARGGGKWFYSLLFVQLEQSSNRSDALYVQVLVVL